MHTLAGESENIIELVYDTRQQLSNARGYEGARAICREMDNTVYGYRENAPVYTINNTTVLSTGNGGATRWIGISGRGKYNYHLGLVKADLDLTVKTLAELKSLSASEGYQVFCVETDTIYNYFYYLPNVLVNELTVVSVNNSSNSRWLGIQGPYMYTDLENINYIEIESEGGPGGIPGGSGSVSTVSVVSANGVSGSVATPTTTPAITLALGAITPSSVAASGTVTGSNLSGNNSGDQIITLTGAVTGSGTGSFVTAITDDAVTLAKIQNITTNNLLGRSTPGSGNVEEISVGTGLSLSSGVLSAVGDGTGTVTSVSVVTANGLAGTVATPSTTPEITLSTSVTGVLKGNGTGISAATPGTDYVAPNVAITGATNTKITYDSKGLVTSGSSAVLASADFSNQGTASTVLHGNASGNPSFGAVVNADLATMPTKTYKGNTTGATAIPTDVTVATLKSDLGLDNVTNIAQAPVGATYIVQTADSTLTNEQALSVLATGILKNTTATGVLSIASSGTDYVAPNVAITGATNTKITYDSKGLVTGGVAATTADINSSTDRNYLTDAQQTALATYVVGPGVATDNAVVRFDATTGKLVQNSSVIIDDSNNVSGVVKETLNTLVYTPTATAPNSGSEVAGQSYYDSTIKQLLFYDAARSKWLSEATIPISVSRNGTVGAGVSFRSGEGVPTSTTPILLGSAMCLVGVAATTSALEQFVLRVDDVSVGSGSTTSINYEAAGPATTTKFVDLTLNTNYNALDTLDVYVLSTASGSISNPVITLFFKYRK